MTEMSEVVTIVDYGLGNLLSVARAFERCGVKTEFTDCPAGIEAARRLVLPGVGAFSDGMSGLNSRGLVGPIKLYATSRRPLMGICLGMQMLFDSAEEFGHHEGLALIAGQVIAIPQTDLEGRPHKIPHMGWNSLRLPIGHRSDSWKGGVLDRVKEEESVYFVHSFTAHPASDDCRLADSYYNGRQIAAVVRKGNVFGCQFHPEKSGPVGLRIIKAFSELSSSS